MKSNESFEVYGPVIAVGEQLRSFARKYPDAVERPSEWERLVLVEAPTEERGGGTATEIRCRARSTSSIRHGSRDEDLRHRSTHAEAATARITRFDVAGGDGVGRVDLVAGRRALAQHEPKKAGG